MLLEKSVRPRLRAFYCALCVCVYGTTVTTQLACQLPLTIWTPNHARNHFLTQRVTMRPIRAFTLRQQRGLPVDMLLVSRSDGK